MSRILPPEAIIVKCAERFVIFDQIEDKRSTLDRGLKFAETQGTYEAAWDSFMFWKEQVEAMDRLGDMWAVVNSIQEG